jgi:hypothetical protein
MSLQEYKKLKDAGVIRKIEKTNTDDANALTYVIYIKKWDAEKAKVGVLEALSDEVLTITAKELAAKEVTIAEETALIAEFKADVV